MTNTKLLEVVTKVVAEETNALDLVLTEEMSADDVPGWDSLAHARIVLGLEIAFGCIIDIDDTYTATNIHEMISVVKKALEDNIKH